MNDPEIRPIEVATSADVQAITSLLAQLSSSAPGFSQASLEAMLADPSTTIFAARADGEMVGMTTVIVFRVATGMRAFIDDVVVREACRQRRFGEALVRAAIDHAASLGVEKIDLTSRPSREAANRLYQRLGFEQRQTNIYRLNLADGAAFAARLPAGTGDGT